MLLGEAAALVRDPGALVAGFLFWPAARPDGSVQPLYGLGWTLNYEAFFYVLFALGLGFGRRGAVAFLVRPWVPSWRRGHSCPGLPVPLRFWSDPIVLEFAAGAGLALAYGDGFRPARSLRIGLALLGVLGLVLAARLLAGLGEADGFLRPLLVGVPAALLVAAALGPARDPRTSRGCPPRCAVSSILGRRLLRALSRASFRPAPRPRRTDPARAGADAGPLGRHGPDARGEHRGRHRGPPHAWSGPSPRSVRALLDPRRAQNRVRAAPVPVPQGRRPD